MLLLQRSSVVVAVVVVEHRLDGRPVMVIGHQKGRETKEKIRR
ncbi:MAG: hypothetical protein ACTS73_10095, partial [Arsenophonus sp. NEOnobi-MAG3]